MLEGDGVTSAAAAEAEESRRREAEAHGRSTDGLMDIDPGTEPRSRLAADLEHAGTNGDGGANVDAEGGEEDSVSLTAPTKETETESERPTPPSTAKRTPAKPSQQLPARPSQPARPTPPPPPPPVPAKRLRPITSNFHVRFTAAKKHPEEDNSMESWYKHKRHVLIFTFSGKPVFSRYGCEDRLATFTGTLSAVVSKAAEFFKASKGTDSLRCLRTRRHTFVFHEKGPLWLVCVSAHGDLWRPTVELLETVWQQLVCILTRGIEKTLYSRPSFDVRPLLGGTDAALSNAVSWSSRAPMGLSDGWEALPLPPSVRQVVTDSLKDIRNPHILAGLMVADHRVVTLATARHVSLKPRDVNLVVNFVLSSVSLRQAESWTPVCLPSVHESAFLYAYVNFLTPEAGVVFLSSSSDAAIFHLLSGHARQIERTLNASGSLESILHAMRAAPVVIPALTPPTAAPPAFSLSPLTQLQGSREREIVAHSGSLSAQMGPLRFLHVAFRVPSLGQVFSSRPQGHVESAEKTKSLFQTYASCRDLVDGMQGPNQVFVQRRHDVIYLWDSPEFSLACTCPEWQGISSVGLATLVQWLRSNEKTLFVSPIPQLPR